MFTGIVEETGAVVETVREPEGRRLRIGASFAPALEPGQSVAVNGVCLTVEDGDDQAFELFLADETLSRTYLGSLEPGDRVNLERALAAGDRLDGHVVQGHVDATAEVIATERAERAGAAGTGPAAGDRPDSSQAGREPVRRPADGPNGHAGDWEFVFSLPEGVRRYVVEKGSIAVDGISLTVASLDGDRFGAAIVPATYEATTLSGKSEGDPVNLEVDVLAKYVEGLLEGYRSER